MDGSDAHTEAAAGRTVVLVAGLPYSGKTAIIQRLRDRLPGEALFIDAIFRDFVPEHEVCLERWLAEGTELVSRIVRAIEQSDHPYIYVEMGILQPRHRRRLEDWLSANGYRVIPVLLECRSPEAVRARQAAREAELAAAHDRLKIAIGLEELYGPISDAFVRPGDDEGYLTVDTARPIEENVADIRRRMGV